MCGLYGFSGKNPVDETKIRWLACMNEKRGNDSTGLFTIGLDKKRSRTLLKKADKATTFIMSPDFSYAVRGTGLVQGHCRAATVGSVSAENAHPFAIGCVVGSHNGFVLQDLATEFIGHDKIFKKDFEVDSQLIFALLDHYKGDYKVLPQLEGALTVAFAVPDKYPDVLYLYRRTPRELHFGFAPEGIYYSSERDALELIGCKEVKEISNNCLVILHAGEIMDIVMLNPPKIKSLSANAQRLSWKWGISQSELDQYPQLKVTTTYSLPAVKKHKPVGFGTSPFKADDANEDAEDIIGTLVESVQQEVLLIREKATLAEFHTMDSYDDADYHCCLVVIKLINNVDLKPLGGFLIYDKGTPKNASVSSLVGTTVLKYEEKECGIQQTLIITDPVDGTDVFTHIVNPVKGRVLEVTLKLPFQEGDQGSSKSPSMRKLSVKLADLSKDMDKAKLCLLPAINESNGGVLSAKGKAQGAVQRQAKQIYLRPEGREIHGDEKYTGSEDENVLRIKVSPQGNGAGAKLRELSPFEISQILQKEEATFELKPECKKLINTQEYFSTTALLNKYMNNLFHNGRLVYEACILKLAIQKEDKISLSVAHYAVKLIESNASHYALPPDGFTDDDRIRISNFTHAFRYGSLDQLDEQLGLKKKKQVQEEMEPDWITMQQAELLGLAGSKRMTMDIMD